ncbi:MAG: hypothetical protein AAB666_00665 [Patescibacteria group bacterium]
MNSQINIRQKTVSVPAVFLKHFYEIAADFSILEEDLFLSSSKKTIQQLKQAKKEHLQGHTKPLSSLS